MTTLSTRDLEIRLRAAVAGSYPDEAAVELLIAHGTWLRRSDFLDACTEEDSRFDGTPIVWIDWDDLADFVEHVGCSGSERRILLLAVELVGCASGVSLSELLSSLDEHNLRLVLDAIARHAGWHDRGHSHAVTGYRGSGE